MDGALHSTLQIFLQFLRTTPPNVSIYSSEIEPQLLQTMDSQFLFNIAKEEEME